MADPQIDVIARKILESKPLSKNDTAFLVDRLILNPILPESGWPLSGTESLTDDVIITIPTGNSVTLGIETQTIEIGPSLAQITLTNPSTYVTTYGYYGISNDLLGSGLEFTITSVGDIDIQANSDLVVRGTATATLSSQLGDVFITSGAGAGDEVIITSTRLVITAANGAIYSADYSGTFTDRSLIDKGFANSNYWKVTGDTDITGQVDVFINTGANPGRIYFQSQEDGTTEHFVSFHMFHGTDGGTTDTLELTALGSIESVRLILSAEGTGGSIKIQDDRTTSVGLQYSADYSADFTDRSLVDKSYNDKQKLRSFTVAGVPSASTEGAGTMIYISNESGGAVPAFSDGTNWRRVTDRTIIT